MAKRKSVNAIIKFYGGTDMRVFGEILEQIGSVAPVDDDERKVLTNVLFRCKDGVLEFAAADGYMLAVVRYRHKISNLLKIVGEQGVLFPAKEVVEIGKRMQMRPAFDSSTPPNSMAGALGWQTSKGGIKMFALVRGQGTRQVKQFQEKGEYPNYRRVIPHYGQVAMPSRSVFGIGYVERACAILNAVRSGDIPNEKHMQISLSAPNGASRFETRVANYDAVVSIMPRAYINTETKQDMSPYKEDIWGYDSNAVADDMEEPKLKKKKKKVRKK